MENKKQECPFGFAGVFILGVVGIFLTANYYLRKEAADERLAREQRVSAEVTRFNTNSQAALISFKARK